MNILSISAATGDSFDPTMLTAIAVACVLVVVVLLISGKRRK